MKIIPNEKAREKTEHPFVRTHHETGKKALYSSISYIQGFSGLEKEESDALLLEFYAHQTAEEITYSHSWSANMLVMWDNRALLHAATGGFDGHDRLLHGAPQPANVVGTLSQGLGAFSQYRQRKMRIATSRRVAFGNIDSVFAGAVKRRFRAIVKRAAIAG